MNKEERNCQNCHKDFTIESEDFVFYEKIKVPAPTWCPECRLIRRIIFRNEHILYKRKDSKTGDLIFSTIPESAPVKVYERDYWWSDNWDPMEYGRDYDFSKPFFEQIKALMQDVPWFSRSVINLVNSDYSANAGSLKNCYMVFNASGDEDCAYCVATNYSKDSFDNSSMNYGELCYGCFMVNKCYRAIFSSYCNDCQNIYFSQNLVNCQNCFGCVGLRNKQYHIFNQAYSREDYLKKINDFNLGSFKNIINFQHEAKNFYPKFPYKYMHGIHNSNVTGDNINYSKKVLDSFSIYKAEHCRY